MNAKDFRKSNLVTGTFTTALYEETEGKKSRQERKEENKLAKHIYIEISKQQDKLSIPFSQVPCSFEHYNKVRECAKEKIRELQEQLEWVEDMNVVMLSKYKADDFLSRKKDEIVYED